MRNYAVPDRGACPGAGDIDALITLFRHRHRVPRLEYIEEDAPRAWPALAAAGFTVDESSGTVAGTGLIDVAGDRPAVGELAAVGVLTVFRRRGIASALITVGLIRSLPRGGGRLQRQPRPLAVPKSSGRRVPGWRRSSHL